MSSRRWRNRFFAPLHKNISRKKRQNFYDTGKRRQRSSQVRRLNWVIRPITLSKNSTKYRERAPPSTRSDVNQDSAIEGTLRPKRMGRPDPFDGASAPLAASLKRSQDERMGSFSPPCLRRLRLKPEDCAPAEVFVQWRGALGEVFEVRATPSEIAAFRGEIDIYASARYVLSASRHSPLSLVRG